MDPELTLGSLTINLMATCRVTLFDSIFNLNNVIQAWSRLKTGSILKSKYIESKLYQKYQNQNLSNQNYIENIEYTIQDDKNRIITI